jgi:hypothetical protein
MPVPPIDRALARVVGSEAWDKVAMIRATLAIAAPFLVSISALAQPSVTSINLQPDAISADGRVVVGQTSGGAAAYWTRAAGVVSLGIPAGFNVSVATAASGDGSVIVGVAERYNNGAVTYMESSWIWTASTGTTPVTVPDLLNPEALCVSRDGSTVGGSAYDAATGFSRGFVWDRATGAHLLPLGSDYANSIHALSSDGLQAAGTGSSGQGMWPTFWQATTQAGQRMPIVAGQGGGIAYAIAATSGALVGDLTTVAFAWLPSDQAVPVDWGHAGWGTHLRAVNDDGSLAAGYVFTPARPGYDAGCGGIIWRPGAGVILSSTYFAAQGLTLPYLAGRAIAGVSANGRVFAINQGPIQGYEPGYVVELNRCGSADFNHDGDSGTDADIEAFFRCLAGSCCPLCDTADFDGDGDPGTDADIASFFRVLAGGAC